MWLAVPCLIMLVAEWEFDEAEHGEKHRCLALQLQRLFVALQCTTRGAVSTGAVTKSFGWEGAEAFVQHGEDPRMLVRQDPSFLIMSLQMSKNAWLTCWNTSQCSPQHRLWGIMSSRNSRDACESMCCVMNVDISPQVQRCSLHCRFPSRGSEPWWMPLEQWCVQSNSLGLNSTYALPVGSV